MKELSLADIKKWRKEFPILGEKIHLANCSQSPQSIRVRNSINSYLDSWRYTGMDWNSWVAKATEAKEQFARLINADVDEISITMSVSDATVAVLSSLPIDNKRNKIVTTKIDFPTIGHAFLANKSFETVFVPAKNYVISPHTYDNYLNDATRLLCVPHVCYQNGFKQNIKQLAELAHSKGAWIYVDAYQSLGTEPIDVKEMNIDMLASGTLKYLLGTPGIAFLYVKKEIANQLKPNTTGWFGQQNPFSFEVDKLNYAKGTRRFDTGTPPVIAAYAACEGLKIINEVTVPVINKHINTLKRQLLAKCDQYNIGVFSPKDPAITGASTAILCDDSHDIEHKLAEQNIIVSARGPVIRIAPHFFTLPSDIDKTLEVLKKII